MFLSFVSSYRLGSNFLKIRSEFLQVLSPVHSERSSWTEEGIRKSGPY